MDKKKPVVLSDATGLVILLASGAIGMVAGILGFMVALILHFR